jgi:integrase
MAVRRRGKKWVADFYDGSGHRRWVTCTTQAEAKEVEAKSWIEARQPIHPAVDPNITFGDYAVRWVGLVAATLKPATVAGYREKLQNHILPALGQVKVRQLQRGRIKTLLTAKLASGLAPDSVRLIYATIRVILNAAVDDGLILANPSDKLGRKLRLTKAPTARQEEIKAFDRDQLSRFLGTTARVTPSLYPLLLTMARSGVRIGEALALQWDDLDFTAREIRVERAISPRGEVDTPKSGHGRTVDMSVAVRDTLQKLQASGRENALAEGEPVVPWVFASQAGTPLDHSNIAKAFKRVLKAAGLPRHHSPHSLRHAFASLLLQQGESPAYVQRQLGHSSIKLTVDTYGRWLPMGNKAAVDRLDEGFKAPEPGDSSKTVATTLRRLPRRPQVIDEVGAPRAIRTPDLQIRSLLLYPAELGAHGKIQ